MGKIVAMLNAFCDSNKITGGARVAIMVLGTISYFGYQDLSKIQKDFSDMQYDIRMIRNNQDYDHAQIGQMYSAMINGIHLPAAPPPATSTVPVEPLPSKE